MDNHADNFIVNDNYIAGLVDGDFDIRINSFNPGGKLQLKPCINFVSTDFKLIGHIHDYLIEHKINHHVGSREATVKKDRKEISINRYIKCIEFIDKIVNYTTAKRPQLILLRDFCSNRIIHVDENGWKHSNTPYTEHQIGIYRKVINLNLNYNNDNGLRNYTVSWLAGMIDCNGTVRFIMVDNRNSICKSDDCNLNNKEIIPVVGITTTSDTSFSNITELFDSKGIKYEVSKSKIKVSKKIGRNKKKFYYDIRVNQCNSVEKLLNYLNGKLLTKQDQLELVLRYLNMRKDNMFNTEEMFKLFDKMTYLNSNNYKNISETNTQDTEM